MSKVVRLIWKCKACKDVVISYSHLGHEMNRCDCGKSAVDLEEFYCRILGEGVKFISEKELIDGKWVPCKELKK